MKNILMNIWIVILTIGLIMLYAAFPGNILINNYYEIPILMSIALLFLIFVKYEEFVLRVIKRNAMFSRMPEDEALKLAADILQLMKFFLILSGTAAIVTFVYRI